MSTRKNKKKKTTHTPKKGMIAVDIISECPASLDSRYFCTASNNDNVIIGISSIDIVSSRSNSPNSPTLNL